MVDVKKVTGTLSKYYLEFNRTTDISGYINFDPTNNPPNPPGSPGDTTTVFNVDPFSLFVQEDGVLKVKIPFSRFYKLKLITTPLSGSINTVTSSCFSLNRPTVVYTEKLEIRVFRNGLFYQTLQYGVYSNPGSILHTDEWRSGGSYDTRQVFTPAVVEGIADLWAGDELRFWRVLTIGDHTYPTRVYLSLNGGTYSITQADPYIAKTACTMSNQFFFEISELTDL